MEYIYMYVVVSYIGRRLGFICQVAGGPSNRRVMSVFPQKLKPYFKNKA